MVRSFLLCLLLLNHLGLCADHVLPTPAFEILCGKGTREGKRAWRSLKAEDRQEIARFSAIFSQHFPRVREHAQKTQEQRTKEQSRIPRVLHFIWLGPRPFPETSLENIRSWKRWHPDWKICFWTDSASRNVPIDGMEKHLIDEIDMGVLISPLGPYLARTNNFGEQSDLIRYALLWQQGGVYVDHDVTCVQSFDALVQAFDFFACLSPPRQFAGIQTHVHLANCLIGVKKGHPIMMATIYHVKQRWETVEARFSGDDPGTRVARVINRTFHSFTLGTKEAMSRGANVDVVLPVAMVPTDDAIAQAMLFQFAAEGLVFARHQMALTWAH